MMVSTMRTLCPQWGATPKLFSVSQDSSALSLYQVPDLEDTVVLGFDYGTDMRDFTISLNVDDMPSVVNVFLLDIYDNTITDLMVDDYTFTFDNNAPTERFRLFASKNGLSVEERTLKNNEYELGVKTWFNEEKLNVQLSEPLENAQIKVLNTLGQELYSQSYRQLENESISFDSKPGLHIVWVISPNNTKSVKVMRF